MHPSPPKTWASHRLSPASFWAPSVHPWLLPLGADVPPGTRERDVCFMFRVVFVTGRCAGSIMSFTVDRSYSRRYSFEGEEKNQRDNKNKWYLFSECTYISTYLVRMYDGAVN